MPEVKPAPAPSAATRELRKKREKALMSWRAAEAKRREVDLQVVLPGHALRDLVALASPGEIDTVAGLGEKRLTLYRAPLLDLL